MLSLYGHLPLLAFLLTRPSRGATQAQAFNALEAQISTHTPLAGRDWSVYWLSFEAFNFYSHAPRGARRMSRINVLILLKFLLTRPSRGATYFNYNMWYYIIISTHTPLAGRDFLVKRSRTNYQNFYSHAPRGARLKNHQHYVHQ